VPQAPQMGVLRQDHLVCYLPNFDGSGAILSLEQIGKLNYFNSVFSFSLAHLYMSSYAFDENCDFLFFIFYFF